jgi:hypothetical protein
LYRLPEAGRKGKLTMSYKLIKDCPVCGSTLKATRLSCGTCGTVIESDLERKMGISYPTVRGKLNDVIKSLGYSVREEPSPDITDVISKLEKGDINIDEAIKNIKK